MIILSCNNISKRFGIDLILENISMNIHEGEKIGLVGINGAGKSTLFKILSGQLHYDEGQLYTAKSAQIGYLEQNNSLDSSNRVYDEVIEVFLPLIEMEEELRDLELKIAELGSDISTSQQLEETMNRYSALLEKFKKKNGYGFRSEARGVLRGLGFTEEEFDQPIPQLSGGEKTRLSLAKLLLSKPNILMLDEPTNHLDISAVEWLEKFLKDYDGSLLIISHDRYFLDQLVSRVMEIDNHRLKAYNGNYTDFVKKKKILRERQEKQYLQQEKEISRQKDIIRRLKQHGTAKLISRGISKEKQLAKIEELAKPQQEHKPMRIHFQIKDPSGNDVLTVRDLDKSFGDTPLFANINFNIYKGERVALLGPNGVGKSSLFRILLKQLDFNGGEFSLGHNVEIGYYDQEQKNLNLQNSVIDEIWDDHISKNETEIRTILASFLFKGEEVFKPIGNLSGGERARLSLLKLIMSKSNFLLLDEPTNHLDIESKEVLEEALLQYQGTIFFISHDRYFLNRIASKVIELKAEGTDTYLGNYDYYVEKKSELNLYEDKKETKTKTQSREERRKKRMERARLRSLKEERQNIEEEIMQLEEELSNLELLMCQEEIYSNPSKSKEIHHRVAGTRARIEELYQSWGDYEI